ncbi:MAG: heme A synthase [Myxococcales bacterium]|nr:heme A synthase [Myxococcales bacterium]
MDDLQLSGRYPSSARRVLWAGLLAQCGIVVTGALVRLTGSGLGCPTWPECTTGSLVPVEHQAQGWHKYIEFGNRMLTFVVAVVCIASLVIALRTRPRRGPIVTLSALGLGGVFAQAVLGGITVLAGLHPATVAAHFLLSIVLIYFAHAAYVRSGESSDAEPKPLVRREALFVGKLLVFLSAVILSLGTIVTGSGPHSGDAKTTVRFQLDPRVISWLHADVVIFFVGLLCVTVLMLRMIDAPKLAQKRAISLLVVSLAQGLIGYVQYFTGLPELLVALHILGALLVWLGSLDLYHSLQSREPAASSS